MPIKVEVVQTCPEFGKIQANVERALAAMENEDADLFVLPELATSGYNFSSMDELAGMSDLRGEGLVAKAFLSLAKKKKTALVYGFIERGSQGFFNSASLVCAEGFLGTYRKTHLFDREKLFFLPGDTGFQVFDLPWGKVGIMICFDWYFPESVRTLALRGAQIIAHPANLVLPNCPDGMVTRCLENRVFSATANRVGTELGGEKPLDFIGLSEIVSPKGEVLCRLSRDRVGVGKVECDLGQAARKKLGERNDLFLDRRPEFYAV